MRFEHAVRAATVNEVNAPMMAKTRADGSVEEFAATPAPVPSLVARKFSG